jgi:hypothetical protein
MRSSVIFMAQVQQSASDGGLSSGLTPPVGET